MSRNRTRAVVAILIIGLALPTFYLVWSIGGSAPAYELRQHRYSQAEYMSPQVETLLRSLTQWMSPDELDRLHDKVGGIMQLSPTSEDPLQHYLRTLSQFSNNMAEIDQLIQDTRVSLSRGDTRQALADLRRLEELRGQAEPLANSLPELLDSVAYEYEVDTTAQMESIERLNSLFQEYSQQIDDLTFELGKGGVVQTSITLYASKTEVFVEEPFFVHGFLRSENGTALPSRRIRLSWGPDLNVLSTTDLEGEFAASILFPAGSPAGLAVVEAEFEPQGSDFQIYGPSTSLVQILVKYRPSIIAAKITPANVTVLTYTDLTGNLSTSEGAAIPSRLITILLDGASFGNVTTDTAGSFLFNFQVPAALSNGTHTVTAAFAPVADQFEPSNVTLPFTVRWLETQVRMTAERATLLSGWSLTITGTVAYVDGGAPRQGNVTVYVDEAPYETTRVRENGWFGFVIPTSIGTTFGLHSLRVEYDPAEPGVLSSEAATEVYVYNIPVLIIAVIAIPSSSWLGMYLVTRSRRRAVLLPPGLPEPVTGKLELAEEATPERLASAVEAERDYASKVRRSYKLAQDLIGQRFDERPRESETHWEYLSRVQKAVPKIGDLMKRLVELFELAEYSPHPVDSAQSEEAKETLLKLRKEI